MDYTLLSDAELQTAADGDDPAALYEKGRRLLTEEEIAGARKYLTFSSTLGDRNAHMALARIYEEEDNFEEAYELYALAYGKGIDEALPKLARLLMRTDRELGLEVLKTNAADGNESCLRELVTILSESGDKKDLKFWKSRLDALESSLAQAKQE